MTHVTDMLTAKNRDHLRNTMLGSQVWVTFLLLGRRYDSCVGTDARVNDVVISRLRGCSAWRSNQLARWRHGDWLLSQRWTSLQPLLPTLQLTDSLGRATSWRCNYWLTSEWYDGWLGGRVVSVLDSGAEGPGFKSQPRRCRVLGKLFTPIVPLFTKQRNW